MLEFAYPVIKSDKTWCLKCIFFVLFLCTGLVGLVGRFKFSLADEEIQKKKLSSLSGF